MKHSEMMDKYQFSKTAIAKLTSLGIITKDADAGGYITPWRGVQLFKTVDVARFLSKSSGEYWSIDKVMNIHRGLFFDVHKGKSERAMYRITLQDFRSLATSEDCEAMWIQNFKCFLEVICFF